MEKYKYGYKVWTTVGHRIVSEGDANDPDHAVELIKQHIGPGLEGLLIQDGDAIQTYAFEEFADNYILRLKTKIVKYETIMIDQLQQIERLEEELNQLQSERRERE